MNNAPKIPQWISAPHANRGALMIVVLIYLAILNLMAVSSARITAMNVSMTQNFIAREQVFQAAQSALSEAERRIGVAFDTPGGNLGNFPTTAGTCTTSTGSGGVAFKLCAPAGTTDPPVWEDDNNWNNAPVATTNVLPSPAATTLCGGNSSPCYMIELLQTGSSTAPSSGSIPTTLNGTIGNVYRPPPGTSVSASATTAGGVFRITAYATLQAGEGSDQKQFVEVMLQSVYGN